MYDPAIMQYAYLNSHLNYNNALVNHLYTVPYGQPELAFFDRSNAFAKGEDTFNRIFSVLFPNILGSGDVTNVLFQTV